MTSLEERAASRPCPVCSATNVAVLKSCRFILADDHPLRDGYDVVVCQACGMAFGDPIPAQSIFDAYYERLSKYTDPASATGGGALEWDDQRVAACAKFLASRSPDRSIHIVDIGCAGGGILRHLTALGFERLTGIDPAPSCVRAVAQIAGVNAQLGSLFDMPSDVDKADLVVLSHVLEHIRDVPGALGVVSNILTPGGMVYIETPDATRYVDYLVAPFLDFNTEHINHFSEAALAACVALAGLAVVESGVKTVASSPSTQYPCAWVLARRQNAVASVAACNNSELRDTLTAYVARSQAMLDDLAHRWDDLGINNQEVIVWGTGQTTAILMANTSIGRARVRYFTDSNERFVGQRIQGAEVVPPSEIANVPELPIVVGSLLHQSAIVESIRARGLTNSIITLGPVL